MTRIMQLDPTDNVFDVRRDLSISPRQVEHGPPKRIDGMTIGIVTTEQSAPHGGEVHPDGDELLYVVSGSMLVIGDSDPDSPLTLHADDACIVPSGEWHRVRVLEMTTFMHVTPGPNGDHRPTQDD